MRKTASGTAAAFARSGLRRAKKAVPYSSAVPHIAVLLALLVIGALRLIAADSPAWFGTPLPPPLSDPRKPIMKHDDVFAPLPAQFAHRPGRHDELLDGAVLKQDHKKIIGVSLESLAADDKAWGRRAATLALMNTLEWTAHEMKTAGLKDAR